MTAGAIFFFFCMWVFSKPYQIAWKSYLIFKLNVSSLKYDECAREVCEYYVLFCTPMNNNDGEYDYLASANSYSLVADYASRRGNEYTEIKSNLIASSLMIINMHKIILIQCNVPYHCDSLSNDFSFLIFVFCLLAVFRILITLPYCSQPSYLY